MAGPRQVDPKTSVPMPVRPFSPEQYVPVGPNQDPTMMYYYDGYNYPQMYAPQNATPMMSMNPIFPQYAQNYDFYQNHVGEYAEYGEYIENHVGEYAEYGEYHDYGNYMTSQTPQYYYQNQVEFDQTDYENFDDYYNPKDFNHLSNQRNYGDDRILHQPQKQEQQGFNGGNNSELAKPQYPPNQFDQNIIHGSKGKTKSDLDLITNPNSKFRELIDEDMGKELEMFRKQQMNSPKKCDLHKKRANPEGQIKNTVFAEAVLGVSTFVKASTGPLDDVLNPFVSVNNKNKDGKHKDLSKFLPNHFAKSNDEKNTKPSLPTKANKIEKIGKEKSRKESGFSLSKFWKKK